MSKVMLEPLEHVEYFNNETGDTMMAGAAGQYVKTDQAEAYAAAKVREALMEALGIVADARDSIGAGALAENAQYERSIVEPHLDGIDDEIRDLIPREPT